MLIDICLRVLTVDPVVACWKKMKLNCPWTSGVWQLQISHFRDGPLNFIRKVVGQAEKLYFTVIYC